MPSLSYRECAASRLVHRFLSRSLFRIVVYSLLSASALAQEESEVDLEVGPAPSDSEASDGSAVGASSSVPGAENSSVPVFTTDADNHDGEPVADPVLNAPVAASGTPSDPKNGEAASKPASPAVSPVFSAAAPPAAVPTPDPFGWLQKSPYSSVAPRSFKLAGFLQGQFTLNQSSESQLDAGGAPLNRDQFALRAARFRAEGGSEYAAYMLELDANTMRGPRVGIRRAEASLVYRSSEPDAPPYAQLTVGVTDVPFGYELVESTSVRWFTERSSASEAFFPTQTDIGVKLAGGIGFLRYAVAVINGQPVNDSALSYDPNSAKDLAGRFGVETTLAQSFAVAFGASFVVGRGFHRGKPGTKDSIAWRDDNSDGVATPNEVIGVPGAAATPSKNFRRWLLGADLMFQAKTWLGRTTLLAEGYVGSNFDRGQFISDPVVTGFDLRQVGGVLGLNQEVTKYTLIGFRVASYNPDSDFVESRRGNSVPLSQGTRTLSPVVGIAWPERARLVLQYDFVSDKLGRDTQGVPVDAKNNQFTARLQVNL